MNKLHSYFINIDLILLLNKLNHTIGNATLVQVSYNSCQITYECTVVGKSTGITIWNGSALSGCTRTEIELVHAEGRYMTEMSCKSDTLAIVARGISVTSGNITEDDTNSYINLYTSQLQITVIPELTGKSIECVYEDIDTTIVRSGPLTIPRPGMQNYGKEIASF